MINNLLTCSNQFKSEYSCAVVRIGELIPIENSDFLAKTLVMGTQIVVRRDNVKTGDLMLYAANETQLNEQFLSLNNLYEITEYSKNSNSQEVWQILAPYRHARLQIDQLKFEERTFKRVILKCNQACARLNKEIAELDSLLISTDDKSEIIDIEYRLAKKQKEMDTVRQNILSHTKKYNAVQIQLAEIKKAVEPVIAEAKKHCGFFNKHGRVRCITLKKEPSFGFLFGLEELQRFCPAVTQTMLEEFEGKEFDTVNGKLFIKAYIPAIFKPVKEYKPKNRMKVANKRTKKFDRLIDGEFVFHYDTSQLQKCIHSFSPYDIITISNKIHGTSVCIGNVKIKSPKKIAWYKRFVNILCTIFKLNKIFIDYNIEYGPIYASRNVVKNKYINEDVQEGYYKHDIWSDWGKIIYPYLPKGMTIYGEIFGYLGTQYIQKSYDYGCEPGQNKLMIYRISSTLENGSKYEWEIHQVKEFTQQLISAMKNNSDPAAENIYPIDILYHGTLCDLYPQIPLNEKWHESVLEALKHDKEHFGMEMNEPLCKNIVPREGICIRRFREPTNKCFKLKTIAFALKEAVEVDAGHIDIEMTQNNY